MLSLLEHNPAHSVNMKLFGREYHFCARCLGIYTTALLTLPVFLWINLNYVFQMWHILVFSGIAILLSVVDFASVDLFRLRMGSNRVRVVLGCLMGLAGMSLLFLLPVQLWVRIGLLMLINMVSLFFILWVEAKKNDMAVIPFSRRVVDVSVLQFNEAVSMYHKGKLSGYMILPFVVSRVPGNTSCCCIGIGLVCIAPMFLIKSIRYKKEVDN
jgi:uncharacterized membrane protein